MGDNQTEQLYSNFSGDTTTSAALSSNSSSSTEVWSDTFGHIFKWVYIVLGLLMMAANGSTFIALARCRRMMKQLQVLTSSLTVSDFLTGVVFILDSTRYGADSLKTLPILTCKIRLYCMMILHLVTYFTVTAMTLDRVLSLYLHMRYQVLVTRGRLVFAVVCLWLFAIGVTSVIFGGLDGFRNYTHCSIMSVIPSAGVLCSIGVYSVCLIVVTCGCIAVYKVVKRHRQHIASTLPTIAHAHSNKAANFHFRSTMAVVHIVVIFVVLYSPVYILLVISVTIPDLVANNVDMYFNISFSFALLNSIVNPIFYAWRMEECRMHQIKLFCCCFRKMRDRAQQYFNDSRDIPCHVPTITTRL
jgi:hypothetical protein